MKIEKKTIVQPAYSIGVSTSLVRGADGRMAIYINRMEAAKLLKADNCRLMRVNEWRTLATTTIGYNSMAFDDYFGRNTDGKIAFEWLEEILQRPKGRNVKTKNGREFNLYTVFVGGKPTVDLWLPDSGVIRSWYDNGFPAETTGSHKHDKGSEIHFMLDRGMEQIALCAGGDRYDVHDGCLYLHASMFPSSLVEDLGFRKVRE